MPCMFLPASSGAVSGIRRDSNAFLILTKELHCSGLWEGSQPCTEFNTQHLVLERIHLPSQHLGRRCRRATSSRSSLVTKQVPGQLGLHETLVSNTRNKTHGHTKAPKYSQLKRPSVGICLSLWDRKLKYRTVRFIISCLAMLNDLPKVPRRKAGWGMAFSTLPDPKT